MSQQASSLPPTPYSTDGGPWFYPDVVSAQPGNTVTIHASAVSGPCTLSVKRLGAEAIERARFDDIAVDEHPIPDNADANGCGWPPAFSFEIGSDWPSGYYDLELIDTTGSNYWGGCNSYANVDAIMSGRESKTARATGIGRLSRLRPFAQNLIAPPAGAPRLINPTLRGPGEFVVPTTRAWQAEHRPTPYDGAAGFVDKWEHRFVGWAETNGYALDYVTDHDFESNPALLDGYAAVLLVGHRRTPGNFLWQHRLLEGAMGR